MPLPLLETKLHIPSRRRDVVSRPRLGDVLRRGRPAALTVVSAPAGFGKTTLLAEWLVAARDAGWATAWLSLDQRDNDPAVFWAYVVAALRTAAPQVGAGAPEPSAETELTSLLNDLHAVDTDIVLVLDDYHVIEEPRIHEALTFFVEHLPACVHLVISSRADPPLPLARWRARGELAEIRATDLRFSADEAAAYLNGLMGLDLTAADVAALETRTEGWIAALQLAALSLQGRADVTGFIAGFAGDDRYVVDYLVGEVLHRQTEDVRRFLLETSILNNLSGALCDAVTGGRGGKAMLEALERANLFVVPLDDRRLWYRYHHLFADMLRARVLDEQPDLVPELHRRASAWYEQQGDRAEAIRHAFAGHDIERAAELVERALPALQQVRQEATLRRWLAALPADIFRNRPLLSIGYVGVLMSSGVVDGVEPLLADAERWLDPAASADGEPVVTDRAELRRLPAQAAVYRAALARVRGDVDATIEHARRALELTDTDDHLARGASAGLLALAYWTAGDLAASHESWSAAVASLERAGHLADTLGCSIALADIRITQGRLHDAVRIYTDGLERATQAGRPVLRGAADMHVGLAELLRERNDLDGATEHLRASEDLGPDAGLPQHPYRWCVAMAGVHLAEGDVADALAQLDEAERRLDRDFFPDVRPIPAMRARVHAASGRPADALRWARERHLSAEDDLSYLREYEHVTLARALLAQHPLDPTGGSLGDATRLLERLLIAAEQGGRTGTVIEVLVLLALAHEAGGDRPAGLAQLERALTLAEPEGYVRRFLDEGAPLGVLLTYVARHGESRDAARRLLGRDEPAAPPPVQRGLVEPLSGRELDVLRLLRTELSGPEIARELVVSLHTVRTHTKNIYLKLGVNSRRAALRRAQELGL